MQMQSLQQLRGEYEGIGAWELIPTTTKLLLALLAGLSLLFSSLVFLQQTDQGMKPSQTNPSLKKLPSEERYGEFSSSEAGVGKIPEPGARLEANTTLPIRSGPAETFPAIALLEIGQKAEVIGVNQDRSWIAIRLPYISSGQGWVEARLVSAHQVESAPVIDIHPRPSPEPTLSQNSPYVTAIVNLNVRSGPGMIYEKVGLLRQGEKALIIGKDAEGYWWAIKLATGDNVQGWVSIDYVIAQNSKGIPVVDLDGLMGAMVVPTPGQDQPTLTALSMLNVRSGPGTQFGVIAQLEQGQKAEVLGISQDGLWYAILVNRTDANRGWVSARFVQLSNATNLPVIR